MSILAGVKDGTAAFSTGIVMSSIRSVHTFARPNGAATVSARPKGGAQLPPHDDILAVVRALAKRAAREDHAREVAHRQQASIAARKTS
jgi:hypothetical protein